MVHGDYQLDENDELKIETVFSKLLLELFIKVLKPLNLDSIEIEQEYSFINIEDIHREIRIFFHTEIGEILRLKNYYETFLIPLLNELGIIR